MGTQSIKALDIFPPWVWVALPPVLAVIIVPEDVNYVTHLMEYSLGFLGAFFAIYEMDKALKAKKLEDKEDGE